MSKKKTKIGDIKVDINLKEIDIEKGEVVFETADPLNKNKKMDVVIDVKEKSDCYTFIKTFHNGGEIIIKGSKLMLDENEVKQFSKAIILTSEYKNSKDCGCVNK